MSRFIVSLLLIVFCLNELRLFISTYITSPWRCQTQNHIKERIDHIQHKPTVIETRKSSYHYKSFLKMNSC